MKLRSTAAILCLTVLTGAAAFCADVAEVRLYEAIRAEQPPTINGKLDEQCWEDASATNMFVKFAKGPAEIQQTVWRAVYDDTHFYLGVTCYEANVGNILAHTNTRDNSNVMSDDALEIFIRPSLSSDVYYQFAANSLGTRFDGKQFDQGWDGDWEAAGSVGENAWYLEAAFSFDSIGGPAVPGDTWGFNVARDRHAGGETEWSSWSDLGGGFHDYENFGHLIFGSKPGPVSRAQLLEIATYARKSLGLQGRVETALRVLQDDGLQQLSEKRRSKIKPRIQQAEQALAKLDEVLSGEKTLTLGAWIDAVQALERADAAIGDAAWDVRIERLLADGQ